MKATFEKTVDILVKAYLNDTLEHTDCWACAVGNLVAHHCGYKIKGSRWIDSDDKEARPDWFDVAYMGFTVMSNYKGLAKFQIDATGYKPIHLAKIENAFESASRGDSYDEWMFNGLMAVVDVLADIHGIDLKQKEAAKLLFQKV